MPRTKKLDKRANKITVKHEPITVLLDPGMSYEVVLPDTPLGTATRAYVRAQFRSEAPFSYRISRNISGQIMTKVRTPWIAPNVWEQTFITALEEKVKLVIHFESLLEPAELS